ncbi:MAG TPA: UrcA family protein [Caulobacteraceae bacterium]|jgi:UrcA family protein|nr:UrcA family protein [Caulobacteraceae bacterium]
MSWPLPIPLIVFSAALAIDAPARAEGPETPAGIEIRFDDLDVRHPGGVRILMKRIQAASAHVCGTAPDPRQHAQRVAIDLCRARVADRIIRILDASAIRTAASPSPIRSG